MGDSARLRGRDRERLGSTLITVDHF
jgi:hypothetical protein